MSKETQILQEIINHDGDCLQSDRCRECPLRFKCLSKWLVKCPSKATRVQMALDTIARNTIMEDCDE